MKNFLDRSALDDRPTDEELDLADCEHSDIDYDERCCLICGRDLTEFLAAEAEYLYEDR